jgi:hypothetical protein
VTRPPDFDELLEGVELESGERERLRGVHDLLVAAGPPPELSPLLARAGEREPNVFPLFPRRRVAAVAALAAALAVALFGAGYLVGDRGPAVDRVVTMAGTQLAPGARAVLALRPVDEAGNWPMELKVSGLPAGRYELWLTREGELAADCGSFVVAGRETVVPLNAPFRLRDFDEWVIVRAGEQDVLVTT